MENLEIKRPYWHFQALAWSLLLGGALTVGAFFVPDCKLALAVCCAGVVLVSACNALGQQWFKDQGEEY